MLSKLKMSKQLKIIDLSKKEHSLQGMSNFCLFETGKTFSLTYDGDGGSFIGEHLIELRDDMFADLTHCIIYKIPTAITIYPTKYLERITQPRTPLHNYDTKQSIDAIKPSEHVEMIKKWNGLIQKLNE